VHFYKEKESVGATFDGGNSFETKSEGSEPLEPSLKSEKVSIGRKLGNTWSSRGRGDPAGGAKEDSLLKLNITKMGPV